MRLTSYCFTCKENLLEKAFARAFHSDFGLVENQARKHLDFFPGHDVLVGVLVKPGEEIPQLAFARKGDSKYGK